jgi:hypothetical protein
MKPIPDAVDAWVRCTRPARWLMGPKVTRGRLHALDQNRNICVKGHQFDMTADDVLKYCHELGGDQ